MHAFFYTQPARRPSIWARPERGPAPAAAPNCLMQLTVDTAAVTALRQMVSRICGEALEFIRIEACDHGRRMRVCLCVRRPLVRQIMDAVMRMLPGAEFGRFSERAAPRLCP